MTADERWDKNYAALMRYMQDNRRRPSKYDLAQHRILNWFKFNKRCLARGKMPAHRIERFNYLLSVAANVQRLNQYAYATTTQYEQLYLDL